MYTINVPKIVPRVDCSRYSGEVKFVAVELVDSCGHKYLPRVQTLLRSRGFQFPEKTGSNLKTYRKVAGIWCE